MTKVIDKCTVIASLCACLAVIIFPKTIFSQILSIHSLDKQVSLEGLWKIRAGDDLNYAEPDFDDSSWDTIHMPGSFISYVKKYNKSPGGICWLRKKIHIQENVKRENPGIFLGTIGNADVTYFNGEKIGETGAFPPDDQSMWNFPRHYPVSRKLIKYGSFNVISVKIAYYYFGDMIGNIAFLNYHDWMLSRANYNFLLININYILIGFGLIFFLIFIIFYFKNRIYTEYLFFSLMLVPGYFIIIDFCNFWPSLIYPDTDLRIKILLLSHISLNVAYPVFLHRFYGFKRRNVEITLVVWLASFVIILFSGVIPLTDISLLIFIYFVIIGIYYLSCHITALYQKKEYAKIFSFLGIIGTLFAGYDIIALISKVYGLNLSIWGYHFFHMKYVFTGFFIFIGTGMVIAFRWINMVEEIAGLNANLESYIVENSLLQNKAVSKNRENTFSKNQEEKIKKVTEYISENYLHNLSREGLAAYVDMHPDSLSRQFNKYSSMKLSDYIYSQRIRDAADRLLNTDEGITDIAFAVGFESLRTFNRIFKKIEKTTPEKYRKLKKKM